MHNYWTLCIIKGNFENFLIHRCNYMLLSQVYCVWQVVKPPRQSFLITLYIFRTLTLLIVSCHYVSQIKLKTKLHANSHLYCVASLCLTAWRLCYFKLNSVLFNVIYYVQNGTSNVRWVFCMLWGAWEGIQIHIGLW